MGLEDISDLDVPGKAERFWRRALEDRGLELRPATVRRALRRHLDDRSEPLYAKQLSTADTAAIAPLIDALDSGLTDSDREEVETLAIGAAIRAGATDVGDASSLRDWWRVHRVQYVEFDPLERIAAHITETRFGRWTIAAITQRLGRSWRTDAPVLDDLAQRAPPTVFRAFLAMVLAHLVALPLAAIAAARRGKALDRVAAGITILFFAVPSFVIALLARSALPDVGRISDSVLVVALALGAIAPISRQARVAVLDVLGQDYVRAARAKGLSPFLIWTRHVARNSIGPIVALASVQGPVAIGGALVAEEILGIDGLGPAAMAAIRAHDLPWLMGLAIIVASFSLLCLILGDATQALIDPRVRVSLARREEG
jgi:peptide/nickel transport system permease protein